MATLYTDVYEFFSSKITEYSFLNYSEGEFEDQLVIYLRSAITEFYNCKIDLSKRNDQLGSFEGSLSDLEKDILAELMIIEFLKPKMVSSEKYDAIMTDSDFKVYSQSNNLREVIKLNGYLTKRIELRLNRYSFPNNLDGLKNGK